MTNSDLIITMIGNTLAELKQRQCDALIDMLLEEHRDELTEYVLARRPDVTHCTFNLDASSEDVCFNWRRDENTTGVIFVNVSKLMLCLSEKSESLRRHFNSIGFTK